VTRGADLFFVAMTGLAAVAAMLFPAEASAATQCQTAQATTAAATTEDAAIAAWSASARQTYGAAWSNFNLAKDPKITEANLALANEFFVTAYACRTITVAPVITRPNVAAAIQRH
jgi:hypothetical protein